MTTPTPTPAQAVVLEALELAKDYARLIRDEAWGTAGKKFDELRTTLAALVQPPEAPAAVEVSRLAWRDVLAERQRQISKEGWTPEHDDEHDEGDLSLAGAVYAVTKGYRADVPPAWPWEAAAFKPRDWRANLVRAGALVLAELERLDRLKAAKCIDPMCSCRGGPCAECPEGQDIAISTMAPTPAPQVPSEAARLVGGEARQFYRHVKTGGDYEWLMSAVRESDQVVVVVYRSVETGVRWVRPSQEFYDGRFVQIDTAAQAAPTDAPGEQK